MIQKVELDDHDPKGQGYHSFFPQSPFLNEEGLDLPLKRIRTKISS